MVHVFRLFPYVERASFAGLAGGLKKRKNGTGGHARQWCSRGGTRGNAVTPNIFGGNAIPPNNIRTRGNGDAVYSVPPNRPAKK